MDDLTKEQLKLLKYIYKSSKTVNEILAKFDWSIEKFHDVTYEMIPEYAFLRKQDSYDEVVITPKGKIRVEKARSNSGWRLSQVIIDAIIAIIATAAFIKSFFG